MNRNFSDKIIEINGERLIEWGDLIFEQKKLFYIMNNWWCILNGWYPEFQKKSRCNDVSNDVSSLVSGWCNLPWEKYRNSQICFKKHLQEDSLSSSTFFLWVTECDHESSSRRDVHQIQPSPPSAITKKNKKNIF